MVLSNFCGMLALGAALSLDSLVAGAGLGCSHIRVPVISALAAGVSGGAAVALFMAAGQLLQGFLPLWAAQTAGGIILIGVGFFKFFESSVKLLLKAAGGSRQLTFTLGGLGVLLDLYLVPAHADTDRNARLGVKEALLLGGVLAVDGAGAGLGAGLAGSGVVPITVLCTILGAAGLWAGAAIGKRASWPALAPVGGLLLMALGVSRLV